MMPDSVKVSVTIDLAGYLWDKQRKFTGNIGGYTLIGSIFIKLKLFNNEWIHDNCANVLIERLMTYAIHVFALCVIIFNKTK